MPENYIQVPTDSSGKKIRTRNRTIGANDVHEQAVFTAAAETWVAYADAVALAQNKFHVAIYNASGSGKVVKLRKLFAVNLQSAAVTGVWCRFDIKRFGTSSTGGTQITPQAHDSTNAALPATVTVRTGGAVGAEGALLFPWITSTDEETAVPALSKTFFQQSVNVLMEGDEIQELVCREGEGVTVKQITNTTVGSYGWILVFTVE